MMTSSPDRPRGGGETLPPQSKTPTPEKTLSLIHICIEGNTPTDQRGSEKHTEPPAPLAPPPLPTIDQVRALLAEKSGEGKTAEVKALLNKYDAGKLSGVKPEDYPALMEEAVKL